MGSRRGSITFVGAGPGAPDLITLRGARALRAADSVLYDRLVHHALLQDLRAELVYVGKRCESHAFTQERINTMLIERARAGEQVVRLKGGDPTVFGRGAEEALACAAAGIAFELVPGITSAVAGPALAGIPVTHRGLADAFCVVTAHRRGGAPDFAIPAYDPRVTLVLLMGVRTLPEWLPALQAAGYPAELPIAFVTRATWPDQRVVVSTLEAAPRDARAASVEAPTVAVVGHTVGLHATLGWLGRTT